jgi:hypothetical protein
MKRRDRARQRSGDRLAARGARAAAGNADN